LVEEASSSVELCVMRVCSHGITHRGLVREENEDAFFVDDTHQVYAVADGLGGLPGGAEVSRRIVELLGKSMNGIDAAEERFDLAELIHSINRIISKEALEAHPLTGAGSTLSLCQLVEDQLLIAHVGDSAVYLLRGGELRKLTTDHTMEEDFIRRMGEAERKNMPREYPHTLTRCIGQETGLVVDEMRQTVQSGDRVLLCTDGLNKVVTANTIKAILNSGTRADEICQALIKQANELSGPDNITSVALLIQ
jgi:protein phosphatase